MGWTTGLWPQMGLKLAVQQAAKGEMLKGVLWLVGGAVVTGITYSAAEPGGTFFVFWGAMAYGAIRFLRGLYYATKEDRQDSRY